MKRLIVSVVAMSLWVSGASLAEAHAFLDHAEPKVGGTLTVSPPVVKIWFTDGLRVKGSTIGVFDARGEKVDKGDVKIDSADKTIMSVSVPALSTGSYKVIWNAVCPLDHHTQGSFTFEVKN